MFSLISDVETPYAKPQTQNTLDTMEVSAVRQNCTLKVTFAVNNFTD